jgi:hypothetical protein
MDWLKCELDSYSFYSKKGFDILIPLGKSQPYDFVVLDSEGNCFRVNAKLAHIHNSNYRINTASRIRDRSHLDKLVDIYLVWLPDRENFIEMDGSFLRNCTNGVKDIPVRIARPLKKKK